MNHTALGQGSSAKTASGSWLCDEPHAAFERVLISVALRGLVEATRVGKAAEVANLQQAGEGNTVLARPRLRQLERGQDTAVQVAEDEIR